MTNTDLQAAINELGNRICIIILDNDRRIRIGYDNSISDPTSLVYKTFGGEDFFGYSRLSSYTGDRDRGVTYTTWHRTDCIQQLVAMDEGYEDYRVDPVIS